MSFCFPLLSISNDQSNSRCIKNRNRLKSLWKPDNTSRGVSVSRQQLGTFGPGRWVREQFCGSSLLCYQQRLTDQSGQRAVRDGWRELDNDEVLVLSELLDLHTLLRHHVQLLQGVGLLRVPDRSDHIWCGAGNEMCQCLPELKSEPEPQRSRGVSSECLQKPSDPKFKELGKKNSAQTSLLTSIH